MTTIQESILEETNMKNIIALIPAYNEEKNIKTTLLELPYYIKKIIVVNDGSNDKTEEEIFLLQEMITDKLVYLSHDRNEGKGKAILTGFSWIQQNSHSFEPDTAIILIDGDGQMNLDYIQDMAQPIMNGKADFVKASRFRGKNHAETMPKFRYFGNQSLKVLNWVASGHWNITDPQNGYFALSLISLQELNLQKIDTGYFFENSMLIETGKLGHQIVEVPVPAIYGVGESSTINYFSFIPKTTVKLILGWTNRIISTRKKNITRKLSFLSSLLFLIFFLTNSILISIPLLVFDIKILYHLTFFTISIIFLLLGIIFDFIDYKNKFDPSPS